MLMPRIDEMPEFRAKIPHSTHDLSHSFGLTATVGHLMPIFHTMIDAGDSIQMSVNFNLRTQPLAAAAMEDIDCHVEYFFVPMFLLYQPFGSQLYQIEDEFSSNFDMSQLALKQGYFPLWNWAIVYDNLVTAKANRPYAQNGVSQGDSTAAMAYRLLDWFNFGIVNNFYDSSTFGSVTGVYPYQPQVFPYQFLAYHCIYQYYYRLDSREKFNNKSFNWDRFYTQSLVSLTTQETIDLFTLHYRPKMSDYFTDVKVSPVVDVLNLLDKTQLAATNQWLSRTSPLGSGSAVASGSVGLSGTANDQSNAPFTATSKNPSTSIQTQFGLSALSSPLSVGNVGYFSNGLDIGTANIRAMFANEKLWSITGRAKKHYDDQTLAHYGFKVSHDPKHQISVFGHDKTKIHIGEVISTASTSTADLGAIAGKGYAHLSPSKHKFKAPCHGVVMAILSFNPRLRYAHTIGKYNAVTNRLDLPIPEYDHLGMQPLFRYECTALVGGSFPGAAGDIMGWQYRYEQWKRRYNRVTSAFWANNPLNTWMISSYPYLSGQADAANTESFADFLYMPDTLNQIMLAQYVTNWNQAWEINCSAMYDFDPFVVDCNIDAKLYSWMSDFSLPRLDA